MTERETGGEEITVGEESFPWRWVTTPNIAPGTHSLLSGQGFTVYEKSLTDFSLHPGFELRLSWL